MAGRSVGNISVTVDADTKRLKAQLSKAGKEAGISTAKAIESELEDIQAEIGRINGEDAARFTKEQMEQILSGLEVGIAEIDGSTEARLLKTQMEAQLRGIELGLDMTEAQNDLREFTTRERTTELLLNVALNKADKRKVAIEVEEMTEEERTFFFGSEVDTRGVEFEIKRLQAERHTIQLLADLYDSLAQARLNKLAAERREVHIRAQIDLGRIEADIARATRRREVNIPITGDFSAINRDIAALKFLTSGEKVDIKIGADVAAFMTEFEALGLIVEGNELKLPVDGDLTRIRAAVATYRALQENDDIEIPISFDVQGADAAIDQAEAIGRRAGQRAASGFLNTFSGRLQVIAGGIATATEPAAVALEGGLAAATSVASSAFFALAGGIGAATPLLAGIAGLATATAVGMQGVGDAVGAVNEEFAAAALGGRAFSMEAVAIQEALAGLAPPAQDFVGAIAELMPQFDAIKRSVQGKLFAGLDEEMRSLATTAIPSIGKALGAAAEEMNRFFKGFSDVIADVDFAGLFEDLRPAIRTVLDAFLTLTRVIEPFMRAATPAAKALADMFERGADRLLEMVEAGEKSGALTEFLVKGVESLELWLDLVGSVGDALFTIFEAGRESGDNFVRSLTDIIDRWDAWLESVAGQQALEEFFANGTRMIQALGPVLSGLADAFGALVTPDAIGRFESLGVAFGDLIRSMGELAAAIGEMEILRSAVEGVAIAFGFLAEVLQPIATLLQLIPDPVKSAAFGFVALGIAIGPIVGIFSKINLAAGGLVTGLGKLSTALAAHPYLTFAGILTGTVVVAMQQAEEQAAITRAEFESMTESMLETPDRPSGIRLELEKLIAQDPVLKQLFRDAKVSIDDVVAAADAGGPTWDAMKSDLLDLSLSAAAPTESIDRLFRLIDNLPERAREAEVAATIVQGIMLAIKSGGDEFVPIGTGLTAIANAALDDLHPALETTEEDWKAFTEAVGKAFINIKKAEQELLDLSSAFSQMEIDETALQSVFDLGNAPEVAAASFRDIEIAIEDLSEAASDIDLSEGLDPSNIKADKLLDALDALRPEIQSKITEAFSVDGADAAIEMANSYIEKVFEELEGKVPREQIATMLGLDSIVADVKVALELSEIENAKQKLAILTGLGGETPWTASIALALDAGTITGAEANALIDARLREQGVIVPIPTEVDPTGAEAGVSGIITDVGAGVFGTAEIPATVKVDWTLPSVDVPTVGAAGVMGGVLGAIGQSIPPIKIPITVDAEGATGVIGAVQGALVTLGSTLTEPVIGLPSGPIVQDQITSLQTGVNTLGETEATPSVVLTNYALVIVQIVALQLALAELDAVESKPSVSLSGYSTIVSQLSNIATQIAGIKSKTVTITVNTVNTTEGGMTGRMITDPQTMNVGERGYREALIPLDLPLNRIDPSVRHLAEVLRGGGGSGHGGGISKQVINNLTITPREADPVAVATKIINRAAAMANR